MAKMFEWGNTTPEIKSGIFEFTDGVPIDDNNNHQIIIDDTIKNSENDKEIFDKLRNIEKTTKSMNLKKLAKDEADKRESGYMSSLGLGLVQGVGRLGKATAGLANVPADIAEGLGYDVLPRIDTKEDYDIFDQAMAPAIGNEFSGKRVANVIGNTGVPMAIGAATGGTSMAAGATPYAAGIYGSIASGLSIGGSSKEDSYNDLKKNDPHRVAKSYAVGAGEGAIEGISSLVPLGALFKKLPIPTSVKQKMWLGIKEVIKGGTAESIEEYLQTLWKPYIENGTLVQKDYDNALESVKYAAVTGGIFGGAFHAANVMKNGYDDLNSNIPPNTPPGPTGPVIDGVRVEDVGYKDPRNIFDQQLANSITQPEIQDRFNAIPNNNDIPPVPPSGGSVYNNVANVSDGELINQVDPIQDPRRNYDNALFGMSPDLLNSQPGSPIYATQVNNTGYDADGYDADGYDAEGYDEFGYDVDYLDRDGYDADGFDGEGFNSDGFNEDGYYRDGSEWVDPENFDKDGYDEDGKDMDGHETDGFKENRWGDLGWKDPGRNKLRNDPTASKSEDVISNAITLNGIGNMIPDGVLDGLQTDLKGNLVFLLKLITITNNEDFDPNVTSAAASIIEGIKNDKDFDINELAPEYGGILNMVLSDSDDINAVGSLIDMGADVNRKDPNSGMTPLMKAYGQSNRWDVSSLMKAGADPTLKSNIKDRNSTLGFKLDAEYFANKINEELISSDYDWEWDAYDNFIDYKRNFTNGIGYNKDGYDPEGYDVNKLNKDGYDEDGFDLYKIDKDGYNSKGYDDDYYDRDGYDPQGYDKNDIDKGGFNRDGYDELGFEKNWGGLDYKWRNPLKNIKQHRVKPQPTKSEEIISSAVLVNKIGQIVPEKAFNLRSVWDGDIENEQIDPNNPGAILINLMSFNDNNDQMTPELQESIPKVKEILNSIISNPDFDINEVVPEYGGILNMVYGANDNNSTNFSLIEPLINMGADVNAQDPTTGLTPLMKYYIRGGSNTNLLNVYYKNRANPTLESNIIDSDGTILDTRHIVYKDSKFSGDPELIQLSFDNWYNEFIFDKDGYDSEGFNISGYDDQGYDRDGYDENGVDRNNSDEEGDQDYIDRISDTERVGWSDLSKRYSDQELDDAPGKSFTELRTDLQKSLYENGITAPVSANVTGYDSNGLPILGLNRTIYKGTLIDADEKIVHENVTYDTDKNIATGPDGKEIKKFNDYTFIDDVGDKIEIAPGVTMGAEAYVSDATDVEAIVHEAIHTIINSDPRFRLMTTAQKENIITDSVKHYFEVKNPEISKMLGKYDPILEAFSKGVVKQFKSGIEDIRTGEDSSQAGGYNSGFSFIEKLGHDWISDDHKALAIIDQLIYEGVKNEQLTQEQIDAVNKRDVEIGINKISRSEGIVEHQIKNSELPKITKNLAKNGLNSMQIGEIILNVLDKAFLSRNPDGGVKNYHSKGFKKVDLDPTIKYQDKLSPIDEQELLTSFMRMSDDAFNNLVDAGILPPNVMKEFGVGNDLVLYSLLGFNKGNTNSVTDMVKQINKDQPMLPDGDIKNPTAYMIDALIQIQKNIAKNGVYRDYINAINTLKDAGLNTNNLIRKVSPKTKLKNKISFFEGGKEQTYWISKDVKDALEGMYYTNEANIDSVRNSIKKPAAIALKTASIVRSLITKTVPFAFRNVTRDVQSQIFTSTGMGMLGKGEQITNELGTNEEIQEILEKNGLIGDRNIVSAKQDFYKASIDKANDILESNDGLIIEDVEYLPKIFGKNGFTKIANKVIDKYINAVDYLNDKGESWGRRNEFKRSYLLAKNKLNMTKDKAIEYAVDRSQEILNFQKSGANVRYFGSMIPLMGANIQGLRKVAGPLINATKAFKKNSTLSTTEKTEAKQRLKNIGKAFLIAESLNLAQRALRYKFGGKELDDDTLNNYWQVTLPNGKSVLIVKGFEESVISNLLRNIWDKEGYGKSLGKAAEGLIPPVRTPIYGIGSDLFTIATHGIKMNPFTKRTSEVNTGKMVSDWKTIQNRSKAVLKAGLGGWWGLSKSMLDIPATIAGKDIDKFDTPYEGYERVIRSVANLIGIKSGGDYRQRIRNISQVLDIKYSDIKLVNEDLKGYQKEWNELNSIFKQDKEIYYKNKTKENAKYMLESLQFLDEQSGEFIKAYKELAAENEAEYKEIQDYLK